MGLAALWNICFVIVNLPQCRGAIGKFRAFPAIIRSDHTLEVVLMPTLDFKGKQHIYAHHLTVPYRPLVPDPERSLNPAEADDNLIIHGDNLHALKALLPRYSGKVNCIYIDPPYNTGNEGWVYNDNVNSPLMKEWLNQNSPVDGEDLERHDKWLCMMWPRLHLLKELLADNGVIFVSIDDNEQHHLRMLMDEIFDEENLICQVIIRSNSRGQTYKQIAKTHEYLFVYSKSAEAGLFELEKQDEKNDLNRSDEIGPYNLRELRNRNPKFGRHNRPNLFYSFFVDPDNEDDEGLHPVALEESEAHRVRVDPINSNGDESCWRWGKERSGANIQAETTTSNVVARRRKDGSFSINEKYRKTTYTPKSIWDDNAVLNETGTVELREIEISSLFDFPKPSGLINRVLEIATDKDSIIFDSFAGSGTTAHAVLALNKADGGNRKFVLVECEDYADTVTAERVRRVINGMPGARDKSLQEGLGGSFTYCTLGKPIDVEQMLTGENLPEYSELAAYLLHTASGLSVSGQLQAQNDDGLFYRNGDTDYYLLYRPDIEWLRTNEAILNEQQARRIHGIGRKAVVFAADKFMGQRFLSDLGITFCQIPYELHRLG